MRKMQSIKEAISDSHWQPNDSHTIIQIALLSSAGIFQMGAISIILSDQLVSGFSCGAAVHVVVSQIPSVLEIKAHKIKNIPFAVFYVS